MSDFNLRSFWNRIKDACKEKRISQKELAARLGIRGQYLSRQIKDAVNTSVVQTAAMADILGVSVEYLITGNERNPLKDENDRLKRTIEEIHGIASN